VTEFVAAQGWGNITQMQPVAGGCINDGRILRTAAGPPLFLKLNLTAPPDMFQREAEGLAAIGAVAGAPRVPAVYCAGEGFLLLEYLTAAPPAPDSWPVLGQQLARLHGATQPRFGFDHDNYIGATPQPNPWTADGHHFFAQQRLRFQAERAYRAGLISQATFGRVEQLAERLPSLVPAQPASLIHGDLWSGNIIAGPAGQACLIDPAAHFGWAEADLAMTTLFGRPPQAFFDGYAAERPLATGYRERFELYNLYHLLNHLNLFGATYLPAVEAGLARYI
jgi:fructosamine-3-kinase